MRQQQSISKCCGKEVELVDGDKICKGCGRKNPKTVKLGGNFHDIDIG